MAQQGRDLTTLLRAWSAGDRDALEALTPLVYGQLRALAGRYVRRDPAGQSLEATGLVHEAWLRLVGNRNPSFNDRAHFFRAAGEAMRRILIDRARRKHTETHGGAYEHP